MRGNSKHKELLSRFEPLALCPRLHCNVGFHYNQLDYNLNLISQDPKPQL